MTDSSERSGGHGQQGGKELLWEVTVQQDISKKGKQIWDPKDTKESSMGETGQRAPQAEGPASTAA